MLQLNLKFWNHHSSHPWSEWLREHRAKDQWMKRHSVAKRSYLNHPKLWSPRSSVWKQWQWTRAFNLQTMRKDTSIVTLNGTSQQRKYQSLSHVWNSCNPMDCILLGSSVHEIPQARILEWIAMPSSWESSWPSNWTQVSYTGGRFFSIWVTREASPHPNLVGQK